MQMFRPVASGNIWVRLDTQTPLTCCFFCFILVGTKQRIGASPPPTGKEGQLQVELSQQEETLMNLLVDAVDLSGQVFEMFSADRHTHTDMYTVTVD